MPQIQPPAEIEERNREILLSAAQIRARVEALAAEISRDYAGRDLLLLCILRGAVVFLADLMRALPIPHAIDFMALSSYAAGLRQSSGRVRITLDLTTPITGRDVLVVEDIVDSGRTLAYVLEILRARRPRSLAVCALLDKAERRAVPVPLRYRGFAIPDRFVFGYGLDIDERYRNLPYIAAEKKNPSPPRRKRPRRE
jgi:hypoxanthine phosphoribosyltransferase